MSDGDIDVCIEATFLQEQYKTRDNLAIRIRTHELYGEKKVDFTSWILDSIAWKGHEFVVDVGCGSGLYVDPVRRRTPYYLAGDLSLGMLQSLGHPNLPRINLDAQALPLPTESMDVVLANHMLYHVPHPQRALQEFGRVLRPGGYLLAATNGAHNMAELQELKVDLARALGVEEAPPLRPRLSFTLENGSDILSRHFHTVIRRDLPDALLFPEPQPVIDYLGSMRERYVAELSPELTWDDVSGALRTILQEHIARHGVFRVNKVSGVFVCSGSRRSRNRQEDENDLR